MTVRAPDSHAGYKRNPPNVNRFTDRLHAPCEPHDSFMTAGEETMLHLVSREALVVGANSRERPTLCLRWELDPHTGKPVGRWVIEGPAAGRLATAA
jgi:hypothetical protein